MADTNSIKHYPVANGDMSLLQIGLKGSGKTVLIDMKIRSSNKDNNDQFDISKDLYKHLPKNSDGSYYVDLFVLTHPDDDHCSGFETHMHTGSAEDWVAPKDDAPSKIIMKEIWFSEICTRRVTKDLRLSPDAKCFRTEAKRRRSLFADDKPENKNDGNRLMVIGFEENDSDKKESWNLEGMVIKQGEEVSVGAATALILGPFSDDIFDEEHQKDKNSSSVIIRWTINGSKLLLGGDATAHIWNNIWSKFKPEQLKYDLLIAPHHCSWRTLSFDSESKCDDPKPQKDALNALSQAESGAYIVSSSKRFKAGAETPPSPLAKKEYIKILDGDSSHFKCISDTGTKTKPPAPRDFKLSFSGVVLLPLNITVSSSPIRDSEKPVRHG